MEARETTLGANKWLSETRTNTWFDREPLNTGKKDFLEGNMTIVVEPEHIRTFIVKMRPIEETWL